ncbi:MAG: hypothetical protein ACE14M_11030 [Terriglobales bacterium]
MATAEISYARADRWSEKNLEAFRALKRRKSDACIAKHRATLEKLAAENGGYVPSFKWLNEHGYFGSYQVMKDYPAAFAHLRLEADKKYEIYQAHKSAPVPLPPVALPLSGFRKPPTDFRKLSEYDVPGAHFNPTELNLSEGLSEKEYMEVGRALASVGQSANWWIGDFVDYGFRVYGKMTAYGLAQQATSYTRNNLYRCLRVAKRFPPARRVAALTFYHHSILASYPPDLVDRLLAEAVELGLTARQVKALAEEECSRKKKDGRKRIVVYLWPQTHEALLERAGRMRLAHFIPQIVEEWLVGKPAERYEANGHRTRAWKEALREARETVRQSVAAGEK